MVRRSSVQPVGGWLRVCPGMIRPHMVRHHIEQDLHSELMCSGDEVLEILHAAEVRSSTSYSSTAP